MRKAKVSKGPYKGHNPKTGYPDRAMPAAGKKGGKRAARGR